MGEINVFINLIRKMKLLVCLIYKMIFKIESK